MNTVFASGFQHGFFYGAVSMALLVLGIWLGCVIIRGAPPVDRDPITDLKSKPTILTRRKAI